MPFLVCDPSHIHTDGGGCHAGCQPAHQELFWVHLDTEEDGSEPEADWMMAEHVLKLVRVC